jgi:hypothetical protein
MASWLHYGRLLLFQGWALKEGHCSGNLVTPLICCVADALMFFPVIPTGCSSCQPNRRKQELFGAGQAKCWRVPRCYHRISARRTLPSAS